MINFAGKVALVTGAGQGIGAAIAITLAEYGADAVVNDRSLSDSLLDVVRQIEALGRRALPIAADVADYEQVRDMIAQAVREMGRIDILVNNAGIIRRGGCSITRPRNGSGCCGSTCGVRITVPAKWCRS